MRSPNRALVTLLALLAVSATAPAQQVNPEVLTLENGMKFLLLPRKDQPNTITAGWVAKVGSVNERPGITGISHFFEHMMFKGTNTIGTNDATKDADFRRRQADLRDRMNNLTWGGQYQRYFRGEIDDPWDPANDTDELKALRAELKSLMDAQQGRGGDGGSVVKDEFDKIYTSGGASGMNAFTSYDLTFYFITVPSNKLELWAWMESDRLGDSVFREFFSERDVVHEERRLRTESTPTGPFQEEFEAMFWISSPYHWPVIGWTSDLNSYTMEEALRYWDIYYKPNNLVGVIVGDFDPAQARSLVEQYFGRLSRGAVEPPPVMTLEMPQVAEMRMNAEADCQPQVEIRYHTVPFRHADSYALDVLAELLNGQTGRLYKGLIEGRKISSAARAQQESRKYAGAFSYSAETKGDATPAELEQAWYEELSRLQEELVPERELQKVKNGLAADNYRQLESNFFLLLGLGYAEALGSWEELNEGPRKQQAVTAEDVRRVARKYFAPTNRSVATYTRKAGAAPGDPEIAALPGPLQGQAKAAAKHFATVTDPAELQQALAMLQAQAAQVPPEAKPLFDYLLRKIQQRIDQLGSAKESN